MVNGWVSQGQEDGVERHTLNNRMLFPKKQRSTRVGEQITETTDTVLIGGPTKQRKQEKLSLLKKSQNIVIVVDSKFSTTPMLFNP